MPDIIIVIIRKVYAQPPGFDVDPERVVVLSMLTLSIRWSFVSRQTHSSTILLFFLPLSPCHFFQPLSVLSFDLLCSWPPLFPAPVWQIWSRTAASDRSLAFRLHHLRVSRAFWNVIPNIVRVEACNPHLHTEPGEYSSYWGNVLRAKIILKHRRINTPF